MESHPLVESEQGLGWLLHMKINVTNLQIHDRQREVCLLVDHLSLIDQLLVCLKGLYRYPYSLVYDPLQSKDLASTKDPGPEPGPLPEQICT